MSIELTDGAILLRPFRAADIEPLYQAVRDSVSELSPWMPWCHPDYSLADAATFINARDEAWQQDAEYSFGIFDPQTGMVQGTTGLNFVNRTYQMANLGYWVRSGATGHGIATRATRLLARFGFEQLQFQRIEITVAVDNLASQRVAEKAGAVREGVLRKRLFYHGQPTDAVMFSLISEDLK